MSNESFISQICLLDIHYFSSLTHRHKPWKNILFFFKLFLNLTLILLYAQVITILTLWTSNFFKSLIFFSQFFFFFFIIKRGNSTSENYSFLLLLYFDINPFLISICCTFNLLINLSSFFCVLSMNTSYLLKLCLTEIQLRDLKNEGKFRGGGRFLIGEIFIQNIKKR